MDHHWDVEVVLLGLVIWARDLSLELQGDEVLELVLSFMGLRYGVG